MHDRHRVIRWRSGYVIEPMCDTPPRPYYFSSMIIVLRAWLRKFGRRTIDAALQEAERKEVADKQQDRNGG